jgi:type IV pilus assembly protein PilO
MSMAIDLKDPRILGWLVSALLLVVLVPVYFFTSLAPFTYASRKVEIAQLESRYQVLSRDLEKARLLVRNLSQVEQEYRILHQQWEVAQTLLPEVNEMPNLLRKVTAAGEQSGIKFALFRPGGQIGRGFYADNPVEVRIEGGYHQTGVFFSRLANLNRIVNISNLKMKGISDKEEEQPFTVETQLTLTAYTLGAGPPAGDEGATTRLAAGEESTSKQRTAPAQVESQPPAHTNAKAAAARAAAQ